MVGKYDLTNPQWRSIAHLVRGKLSDRGRTGFRTREFIDGVLWIMHYDRQWADLPARYGEWKTVHQRFIRWRAKDVWDEIFETLTASKNNKSFVGNIIVDTGLDHIEAYHAGLGRKKRVGKMVTRQHGAGQGKKRLIRGAKRPLARPG